MPYLVAAELPTAPAGERFRALLSGPDLHCRLTHAWRRSRLARQLRAVYLPAAMRLDGPDRSRRLTVDDVCFFIRQVARASGLGAAAGDNRLRRGTERHAHGCATRRRAPGGPVSRTRSSQEMRPC